MKETQMEKFKKGLKYLLIDSTSILTPTSPILAAMEVGIAGMSDSVSLGSRLSFAGLSYIGLGPAYAKGRDFSRSRFKINNQTKESIQTLHDSAYTIIFNLLLTPPVYLAMGADVRQSAIGGLAAAGMGVFLGPVMGYSVDVGRDLTGLKKCERSSYPESIRKQSSSVKLGLAGVLVAGAISAMAGIYSLTPNKSNSENPQTQTIETVVSH